MSTNIQIAKQLAVRHGEIDPEMSQVFLAPSPPKEIRLLEVTEAVPTTREVVPFTFAPTEERDFSLTVVLVSQKEHAELLAGDLDLPHGWEPMGTLTEVWVRKLRSSSG